jgi:hypothetical protein
MLIKITIVILIKQDHDKHILHTCFYTFILLFTTFNSHKILSRLLILSYLIVIIFIFIIH